MSRAAIGVAIRGCTFALKTFLTDRTPQLSSYTIYLDPMRTFQGYSRNVLLIRRLCIGPSFQLFSKSVVGCSSQEPQNFQVLLLLYQAPHANVVSSSVAVPPLLTVFPETARWWAL
ncbi:unnamed protein product, partial [Laminaria digitata]